MLDLDLALKSLRNRAFSTSLTVGSIGLSVALLIGVENVRVGVRESFSNTISQTDLIVGAKGGTQQLLLYSVFGMGSPTENMSWDAYQQWAAHPAVEWTVPYGLGDNHRGFRVIGTNEDFLRHYRYRGGQSVEVAQGRGNEELFDVMLGADAAEELGYGLGDEVSVTHGLGEAGFVVHDHMPFTVVGILDKTFTPVDRAIYVTMEGLEAIHWEDGAPPEDGAVHDHDHADEGDEPAEAEPDHAHEDDADAHEEDEGAHAHDEGEPAHDEADHAHEEDADAHEEDEGAHAHDEGEPAHDEDDHAHEEDADAHEEDEGAHAHDEGEPAHEEDDHAHEEDADAHEEDEGAHAHDEGEPAHEEDEHAHEEDADAHAEGEDEHVHDEAEPAQDEAEPAQDGSEPAQDDAHAHEDDAHAHAGADLSIEDVEVTQLAAFFVGTANRRDVLSLQREINDFEDEPMSAVIPGVALNEMWQGLGYLETGLRLVTIFVVLVGLLGMLVALYTSLNERRREMAILRAVGAGPRRIVSLLVLESACLSAAGAACGLGLAYLLLMLGQPIAESRAGLFIPISPPGPVEWAFLGAVVVAGFLIGFVPAWKAYRNALHDGLVVRV